MDFKLSNSKLKDWENMCPREFKAKHITKDYPSFVGTKAMFMGNIFETLVIGGGINGAVTFKSLPFGPSIENSVYGPRIVAQAEAAKTYLKALGGKMLSRQEYICTELVNPASGEKMTIEGTLDIRYMMDDGLMVVIDLKFTADTENDFGDFAWGSPEKMDLSQIKHYSLLTMLAFDLDYIPVGYYWVFDHKETMKKKLIKCTISEWAMQEHINRLFEAWNAIQLSIMMDDWEVKNTWENCSKCKSPCNYKRVMPEYTLLDL